MMEKHKHNQSCLSRLLEWLSRLCDISPLVRKTHTPPFLSNHKSLSGCMSSHRQHSECQTTFPLSLSELWKTSPWNHHTHAWNQQHNPKHTHSTMSQDKHHKYHLNQTIPNLIITWMNDKQTETTWFVWWSSCSCQSHNHNNQERNEMECQDELPKTLHGCLSWCLTNTKQSLQSILLKPSLWNPDIPT